MMDFEHNQSNTRVIHLCTVWEATRKDIKSPADISSPDIKDPPAKMVPRTMPVMIFEEKHFLTNMISISVMFGI